jgi:hypothetical protein
MTALPNCVQKDITERLKHESREDPPTKYREHSSEHSSELDKLQATTPPLDIVSRKLREDLLSIDPLFIANDELATTFISVGLVLLTASLLNTWTAESLASSTGLPLKFVKGVIQDMNEADL